jgi:hypothetical protein
MGFRLTQTTTNAGARTYSARHGGDVSGAFATARTFTRPRTSPAARRRDCLPAPFDDQAAARPRPARRWQFCVTTTRASPSSGGVKDGDHGDITVSGTGHVTVDSVRSRSPNSPTDITTNVSTFARLRPEGQQRCALPADATWAGTQTPVVTKTPLARRRSPRPGTLMMVVEVWAAGGGGGGDGARRSTALARR